jgi:uncharacterized protein YjbI with pentapeptide repeats
MKRKQTFNKLEKLVEKIPTWLFATGAIIVLALIALWLEEDHIESFRDSIRVLFEHAESIAIVAAVIFFFKEAPSRKAQKHYEAWQVIDHAAAAKVSVSYARIQALQDLNQDGVSLGGLDLSGAHLQGVNLQGATLINVDLRGADLVRANLRGANLSRTDLRGAILIDADLRSADLSIAALRGAILGLADLRQADLVDADLTSANLIDADLNHANLRGATLYDANLCNADLRSASLYGADLRQAKNFTLEQVKSARNWEKAIYDEEFSKTLGIPYSESKNQP